MREYYTAATRTHCSILGLNEPHGSDFKPKKPDPEKYLQSQSIYRQLEKQQSRKVEGYCKKLFSKVVRQQEQEHYY